ncbi:MAG TPA: efflux RND transporter periplasmic adaptor subunit [Rhizomicrobium sp.]|nr:efflux RND transporter periplasmic adaptor subunit [Rhizomicrobium sp.]
MAIEILAINHAHRWALSAAMALALLGCGPAKRPPPPPPDVGVVTLEPAQAVLTAQLPGRTDPYATSDVRPQVSGILKSILFTEGGLVHAGQPLYQIDPAPYRAAYDSAKAALANAEANLTSTRLKAERFRALLQQNAVAKQDYDDAEAAYKQGLANVEQQKANLESARINLGYTRVTAPITGRIGRSLFTQGALVIANQTNSLATIQTLDPIYVDMDQSSAELLRLEQESAAGTLSRKTPSATRVTLQLEDGTPYAHDGTLQFSEVTVDPTTGAVVLRAEFPNPEGLLLPGMYVRATIIEGIANNAILAPQRGVGRNEKGEPTALVVDGRGIARLRVLKAPRAVGSDWLVAAGLQAGDKLIVDGLQKVQPDQPVRAVPAGSQSTSSR